jgi:glycosyltransferase involved in cell wall biosynthesis
MSNKGTDPAGGNKVAERLVIVGGTVPQEVMDILMKVDPVPQVQTYKTSWALVRGLETAGQVVDLISTVPMFEYPKTKWIWVGYRKWDRGNGSDNWILPFINILGWKHLTRFLSCVVFLFWWCIKHRKQKRHVMLYNILSSHMYAVLFVRLFFRIKTSDLVLDFPGLCLPPEPWWRSMVRPIDRGLIYHAMRSVDGLIVLTREMAKDRAPKLPMIVMEGILSLEMEKLAKTQPAPAERPKEFIVYYAGSLGRAWGVPLVLDAFKLLPGDDCRLWLFGRGDLEGEVRRCAQEDPRICYPGKLVSTEELFQRSQEATVLINPRPAAASFSRYSFPSKVLEYMTSGRPVLTTRLSSMPKEYAPFLLYIDEETPEALAAQLQRLREIPSEQLDELGRQSREFVLQEKTYQPQGKKIMDFIHYINSL